MKIGMGYLKWTPEVYWSSTPDEYHLAFEGLIQYHKAQNGTLNQELSSEDVNELQDFMEKHRR